MGHTLRAERLTGMAKIGIILGSTRDDRAGQAIAQWVADLAQGRNVEYELIDLKAFDVPVLTTSVIPMAANKKYDDEKVQAWSLSLIHI